MLTVLCEFVNVMCVSGVSMGISLYVRINGSVHVQSVNVCMFVYE